MIDEDEDILDDERDISFDEWFDIFEREVQALGYEGPLDKYTFEDDYESTVTPEAAAKSFVQEMMG